MKRKAIPLTLKLGIFVSILLLPSLLPGQSTPGFINRPALGFVFDSGARTLKPILGVPGASLFGTPLDTGLQLAYAAISPRQDYAILLAGDNREVKLLPLLPANSSASSIDGVLPAPDRIVFSPLGSAIALYRIHDALFQIITGLPDSPVVAQEIPASNLGGDLTSLAISDDGQQVLAAVANNDSGSSILFASDGVPRQLPVSGHISAMAFRPQTHAAVIVNQDRQVLLFSDLTANLQSQVLAGPDDGISAPVAIAFSADGVKVFVANSDTGNVAALDLLGGAPSLTPCQCTPTGLHRLAGNSVFRLNDPTARLLQLFDGDATTPRVVFVPPDSPTENSQRGDQ